VLSPNQDRPSIIAPPPLIYLAGFGVGLLLDLVFPLPLLPEGLARILGWLLISAALLSIALSLRVLFQAGTPVDPYKPTTVLVMDGPFRYSRNPLYLSLTAMYTGVAMLMNVLWLILLLPLILWIIQRGVIAREEEYLERKFGEEYRRYKARTPRWLF
jgi:protein-S-isoprenylcysteine O-methyltransferase Ste14